MATEPTRDECEKVKALESFARAAIEGIREAVRIMDLMGRGQDARNLDVYRNNLEAALRVRGDAA